MLLNKALLPLGLALIGNARAVVHGGNSECGLVNVMAANLLENLAAATADKGLDKAWSINVASDVFENEHLYMGVANYKAIWTPSSDHSTSRCPSGTPGGVFQAMYDDHVSRCVNYVQTGILDAPKSVHRTFDGCGCAELIHIDLEKNAVYDDKWAVPGFAACAGKDKLFSLDDINPLVEKFCDTFVDKRASVVPGAKVHRTFDNIEYEIEPLFVTIPPFTKKRSAQSTKIHIFAAFDHKACSTPKTKEWPTKARCIENIDKAIEASSFNGICTYECSLAHAKNGNWELNYCQNFHAPLEAKTTGGYFWSDCFRWGVVDDLEEGILGAVVLDN